MKQRFADPRPQDRIGADAPAPLARPGAKPSEVLGLATLPPVIDTAEHLLSKGPAGAGVPWSVARCRSSRFCAAR